MTQSFQLSAGVSSLNLSNDSYLIIVYGEDKDNYSVVDFNSTQKQQVVNSNTLLSKITAQVSTGVAGKVGMALWTSPVVQNIIGKNLPNSVIGRINSSLYDIMADGKVSVVEVAEDLISNCTNILDNVATDLGFPTPTGLYDAITPDGMGVPAKDFANFINKRAQEENNKNQQQENDNFSEPENVLKFKLVTKDSETLSSDIPTRKTETGTYLTQVIGNQNKTKNFTVSVINNPSSGVNMYQIKKQLEDLRNKKESFNVYVCDSDVNNIELFKNCVFSNISIDTEGKNSLNIDLSIVVIPEYAIKIDTNLQKNLDKNIGSKNQNKRTVNPNKNSEPKGKPEEQKPLKNGDKRSLNTINFNKRLYLQNREAINKPPKSIINQPDRLQKYKEFYASLMKEDIQRSTKILKRLDPNYGWTDDKVLNLFNSNFDFSKLGKNK